MKKDKRELKVWLIFLYISIWLLFFIGNRFLFHNGYEIEINKVVGFAFALIVFLIMPYLLNKILKDYEIGDGKRKALVYGSLFLIIPFVLLTEFHTENELELYNKKTIGTVNKDWVFNRKGRKYRSVQAVYKVDGKAYFAKTEDSQNILRIGDTVTVIYSSETPGMSIIKEIREYSKK